MLSLCNLAAIRDYKVLSRIFAIIGLLLFLGACNVPDRTFTRAGIGPEIYHRGLQNSTNELADYFFYICQQASIPGSPVLDSCTTESFADIQWRQFVYTGFNDIDLRCDNYLAWVEEIRNQRLFANSILSRTGSLTNYILGLSLPDTAKAIGIVAEVFGYARGIFLDIEQLIIPGIEGSTIKLIVGERRLKFRQAVAETPIRYKPDAVNLLQSYLRICMPHTITMSANAYARSELIGSSIDSTVLGTKYIASTTIARARPQTSIDTPGPNVGSGPDDENNNVVAMFGENSGRTPAQVVAVQKRLCVNPTGNVQSQTRTAIAIYRRAFSNIESDGGDGPFLPGNEYNNFIGANTDCSSKLGTFMNIYESANLRSNKQINDFVAFYNQAFPNSKIPTTPQVKLTSNPNDILRVKAAEARKYFVEKGLLSEEIYDGRPHITHHLFLQIVNLADENNRKSG